ncbi:MAG: hypothetical protein Unbinned5374contig1001_2 [Prokaryotic dsDNA virus sp.]|nr:MAG: hypothetical protein Unbinned5374contig1001_2 [Prokaryotic dsDNA virus sp.]|tara:strand:+ start:584 stop:835 length:252 start_codon:yes stop_codon:yes gene_type:complete
MFDKAIKAINPNAVFRLVGSDLNDIEWLEGTTPIAVTDIEAKIAELPTWEELDAQQANLKASAKAKLIAGEALTEDEANTIVL